MSLLVRKIDKGKWLQTDIFNDEDVSADAITNCMKTTNNTLSTWHIENESELDNAVLAIISNHQHMDTIDVVWLNKENLHEQGISFKHTIGVTPVKSWSSRHVDIVDLNYRSLGRIASCVVKSFKETRVKRYTRGMLRKILKDAIESGHVDAGSLSPSLISKLA